MDSVASVKAFLTLIRRLGFRAETGVIPSGVQHQELKVIQKKKRRSKKQMTKKVFVLDKNGTPLMPTHPARARELQKKKAKVYRRFPFTIILTERIGGVTQPLELKLDPGSRHGNRSSRSINFEMCFCCQYEASRVRHFSINAETLTASKMTLFEKNTLPQISFIESKVQQRLVVSFDAVAYQQRDLLASKTAKQSTHFSFSS
eukprot:TRINITY_DN7925_c0_g1_i5.p1 TRINITY_DN7925_c0_g1~~TRINITY_DN7925_c0_g1_i5.p1  ORF type:complete len:203 (+),score=-5.17 TRINITY_DN7925_c0_g1_i5:184-792(+)